MAHQLPMQAVGKCNQIAYQVKVLAYRTNHQHHLRYRSIMRLMPQMRLTLLQRLVQAAYLHLHLPLLRLKYSLVSPFQL